MFHNFKLFLAYFGSMLIYLVPGFFELAPLGALMAVASGVYAVSAFACGFTTDLKKGKIGLIVYAVMIIAAPAINMYVSNEAVSMAAGLCNLFVQWVPIYSSFAAQYICGVLFALGCPAIGIVLAQAKAARRMAAA